MENRTLKNLFVTDFLSKEQEEEIFDLLCQCNYEFIPPLTQRNSTTQSLNRLTADNEEKPCEYFNEMRKQEFILTLDGEKTIAFLSYKNNYFNEKLESEKPSFYISTVCIDKEYRGKGILHTLYNSADELAVKQGVPYIVTRTWSTHEAQIVTLKKHGFKVLDEIKNDRGNGIGTVYFFKEI